MDNPDTEQYRTHHAAPAPKSFYASKHQPRIPKKGTLHNQASTTQKRLPILTLEQRVSLQVFCNSNSKFRSVRISPLFRKSCSPGLLPPSPCLPLLSLFISLFIGVPSPLLPSPRKLPILCWYRPTGALAAAAAARGVGIAGGGAGVGVQEGGGRLTTHCLGNSKLTRETKKRKGKLHKR